MSEINLFEEATRVSYPGRGIVIGRTEDGKKAVAAYWTMGRSAGSRNRIFVTDNENGSEVVRTKALMNLLLQETQVLLFTQQFVSLEKRQS